MSARRRRRSAVQPQPDAWAERRMWRELRRQHQGYWIAVDGSPMHVTGDPAALTPELHAALAELFRAARKMIEERI